MKQQKIIYGIGSNAFGQLFVPVNDRSLNKRYIVPDMLDIVQLQVGDGFTVGLLADGSLIACGSITGDSSSIKRYSQSFKQKIKKLCFCS